MDHLVTSLQIAVYFISALGNMFLVWRQTAKGDEFDENVYRGFRPILIVLVGLIAALLAFIFFEKCWLGLYLIGIGLIVGFGSYICSAYYRSLKERYTVEMPNKGSYRAVRVMKGKHTPWAQARIKSTPYSTDMELLQQADGEMDKVWSSESRARNARLIETYHLLTVFLLCTAIILGAIGATLAILEIIDNRRLGLIHAEGDCSSLGPSAICPINIPTVGCNRTLYWSTDPPNMGTFPISEMYQAPEDISKKQWITLIVRPEHSSTSKKIPVHLVPPNVDVEKRTTAILYNGGKTPVGSVEVLLISAGHSWMCGRDDLLKNGNASSAIIQHLVNSDFSRYTDIVAFGAASHEFRSIQEEEDRALRRANQLGKWIDDALNHRKSVYIANLGKYDPEQHLPQDMCMGSSRELDRTADERRLIIVGIIKRQQIPVKQLTQEIKAIFKRDAEREPIYKLIVQGYRGNWELTRYDNSH